MCVWAYGISFLDLMYMFLLSLFVFVVLCFVIIALILTDLCSLMKVVFKWLGGVRFCRQNLLPSPSRFFVPGGSEMSLSMRWKLSFLGVSHSFSGLLMMLFWIFLNRDRFGLPISPYFLFYVCVSICWLFVCSKVFAYCSLLWCFIFCLFL